MYACKKVHDCLGKSSFLQSRIVRRQFALIRSQNDCRAKWLAYTRTFFLYEWVNFELRMAVLKFSQIFSLISL